MTYSRYK